MYLSGVDCDPDWIPFNDWCYRFREFPMRRMRVSWEAAQDACAQQLANLVSVLSLSEQQFIYGELQRVRLGGSIAA